MIRRALDLLDSRRNDVYEAALAALPVHAQETRADVLVRDPDNLEKDEAPASADADGLRRFLRAEELPWLETWKNDGRVFRVRAKYRARSVIRSARR
jgi:hypothetical protein